MLDVCFLQTGVCSRNIMSSFNGIGGADQSLSFKWIQMSDFKISNFKFDLSRSDAAGSRHEYEKWMEQLRLTV